MKNDRALDYIFHHVFLPPRLPQEDDYKHGAETVLLRSVSESLTRFQRFSRPEPSPALARSRTMLQRLSRARKGEKDGQLSQLLAEMDENGRSHKTK
jgi:hypothetical protein